MSGMNNYSELKTSTQIFIEQVNEIHEKFSGLIARGEELEKDFASAKAKDDADYTGEKAKIDRDFAAVNTEIYDKYNAEILAAESARDILISKANSHFDKQKKQFESALNELDRIKVAIPQKFKTKYGKAAAAQATPKAPDFQAMVDELTKIQDPTFGGHIKRLTHFGKYYSNSKMAGDLLDAIESGRAYINAEQQKWAEYKAQTTNMAIEEFKEKKAEADKKKPTFLEPNRKRYEEDLAYSNSKHETTLAATRSKYDYLFTEHHSTLETELNNPDLPRLDGSIRAKLDNLGFTEDGWEGYTPADKYPTEMWLGNFTVPFDLKKSVGDTLREKMPGSLYSEGETFFSLPFTVSMKEPLNLLVEYDKDKKDKVMEGIQGIILKLIRFMPPSSFKLSYIDPNDRGTNLGPILKLAASTADIFKKTYASKEDIEKRLKELEAFVDETSTKLAGVENVYLYNDNDKNDTKIPYHFIVINDYPDHFDNYAKESLQILLKNSAKCGLSFIFTSNNFGGDIPSKIKISVKGNGAIIYSKAGTYNFAFSRPIPKFETYVQTVKTVYDEGIKGDKLFKDFFPAYKQFNYEQSKEGSAKCVKIPFAVDSVNRRVELELGGPQSVNALLSGRTGSGKSTTLHILIQSIIMNYHPDDVELWLVDYKKVEFTEYLENLPPHIRLLGLERNSEFTFSLLDKLDEVFQERMELFKKNNVKSITEYKEKFGVRSIPRIIFIVDEFHQMTQAIKNEPHYVQILENILSEYRAFGLSCVFSDQAISDGLRGLTEKGKKQISIRIAMENDAGEVRETLSLDNSFYDEPLKTKIQRMTPGDVIFKRLKDDGEPVLDKYKTIKIESAERAELIKRAIDITNGNYTAKDILIIDGQRRAAYDEQTVTRFEKAHSFAHQIPIFAGTPSNLEPCFTFALRKKTDSNIMVVGSDDDMRASVLLHTIRSFKRQPDTSLIIFAYKSDEIYRTYQSELSELLDENDRVITKFQDMCNSIEEAKTHLDPDNEKRILLCWLGLEEITDEFSVQPEKRRDNINNSNVNVTPVSSSVRASEAMTKERDALLDILQGSVKNKTPVPSVSGVSGGQQQTLYNANSDIQELFTKGSRYNVYSFVTFSSVKMIRQTKFVKLENFEHKIALSMSMDDSTTYLGRGAYASGLDNISAVYDDGSGKIRTFRPYTIGGTI